MPFTFQTLAMRQTTLWGMANLLQPVCFGLSSSMLSAGQQQHISKGKPQTLGTSGCH